MKLNRAFLWILVSLPLVVRLLCANTQIDWDEELYFQIAKQWSLGQLPYTGIFDHKPPALYLYYRLFTFGGESMASLRVLQSLLLAASFFSCFKVAGVPRPAICSSIALAAFSYCNLLGSNSESLYVPLIAFCFVAARMNKPLLFGLLGAVAVAIKYTALLDLVGCFVAASMTPARSRAGLMASFASFVLASLSLHVAFHVHFAAHGVDIWTETVVRNLQHSASERKLPSPPRMVSIVLACILIGAALAARARMPLRWPVLGGMGVWTLLSFAQACVTGKSYSHYFGPIMLPAIACLALLGEGIPAPRLRWILPGMAALMGTLVLPRAARHLEFERATKERLSHVALPARFHYHGNWLAIYRHQIIEPLKYMFPLFYVDEHFERVSGSGGLLWVERLEVPVVYDDGKVMKLLPNGQELARILRAEDKDG